MPAIEHEMVLIFSDHKNPYIADYCQLSQHFHNLEPNADILRPLRHSSPCLAHKLLSIQSDLHPVIKQGKQRSKGEGGHEYCDEAKLED